MLSLDRMRVLMAGEGLSDAELEDLRVLLWMLAQIAFDQQRRTAARRSATDPDATTSSYSVQ